MVNLRRFIPCNIQNLVTKVRKRKSVLRVVQKTTRISLVVLRRANQTSLSNLRSVTFELICLKQT